MAKKFTFNCSPENPYTREKLLAAVISSPDAGKGEVVETVVIHDMIDGICENCGQREQEELMFPRWKKGFR